MKRIGILGGTFNPIHVGHLGMAEVARERLNLDYVIFVPSNTPPHKSSRGVVSGPHRLNMVRLAIRGNAFFKVSDFELKKKGPSYSIYTVEYFLKKFPKGTKLYFIIGADMAPGLKTWKRFNELKKLVTFVAVDRPHSKRQKAAVKSYLKTVSSIDVSSSEVRRRIVHSKTIKYLVPDSIGAYIKKKRLYKHD